MADTPKKPNPRKGQPRVVKDKVVFVAFKGQLEHIDVFLDGGEAVEAVMEASDKGEMLKIKKIVIPVKRRKPVETAAA